MVGLGFQENMHRKFQLSVVLVLFAGFAALAQVRPVEGELLVKFKGGPHGAAALQAEQTFGHEVQRRFERLGWQHVRLRPGQTLAQYRQHRDVLAAEPNYVFQVRLSEPNVIPNDPRFFDQWALAKIGATNAWALTTGSSNVVVAVLDSGIRYTHEDLAANMWRNPNEIAGNGIDDDNNGYIDDIFGIDAVNQDSDPADQAIGFTYHGSACASIIGAVGNNARGVTGVSWPVRLMALRLAATANVITTAWQIECFEYVLMMKNRGVNIRVTSNSWGGDAPSQAVRDALEALGNAGVMSVFAAGNSSTNVDIDPDYPAAFRLPGMMNVAASDELDRLASFSNYGPTNVDLAAPGVNIQVADGVSTNNYNPFFQGTSAACPQVAGAAALLAAAYPSATVEQIKTALTQSVDRLPAFATNTVSGGRLNVGRAIYEPILSTDAPPAIHTPPLSQTVGVGYPATFCVIATGAQPLDYFWFFASSQVAHTTEPVFTIGSVAQQHAGDYLVILSNAFGLATSAVATLTVVTNPTILAQPQGLRVLDGTNVSLRVNAAGAFPLSYQWQQNGVDLPGETNPVLQRNNTDRTMTGDYRVIISNNHGSITSDVARLTVFTRPHVVVQPQSQTVAVGANVSLSVTVTNTANLPIGYRWRRPAPGSVISLNEFTSVTNLFNIQTNLSGIWSVFITNEAPSGVSAVTSSNAYLTVVVPPTNRTALAGSTATFNAIAVGPAPIRYQWQRAGANIPNATNQTLVLTNVQPSEAGEYSVVVTNIIGQPAVFTAALQVVGPPLLTQPERLPDGDFRMVILDLVAGQQYTVEISANLTGWNALSTFTAPAATMPFVDDTADQAAQRFYRVRSANP